ncbi:MAG: DUF2778 domain-containing protein [Fimbriimonadaceae bacterium]|nr:DUF2778 domain-containing protein [Fimbriimonadaceae bacterium]
MRSFTSPFVLLVVIAVGVNISCPSMCAAQTIEEFNAVVTEQSKNSPAGGPAKNPNAVVLVYLRASKKLCWVADGKVVSVETVSPRVTDDKKEKGPTPVGEYLIGTRFKNATYHIDWYKLYPRIEDNSGYYGYTTSTKTGRDRMGLHPGSISEGCVTVKSSVMPYDTSEVWKVVRSKLDSGKLSYKNDDFNGLLYVVDK